MRRPLILVGAVAVVVAAVMITALWLGRHGGASQGSLVRGSTAVQASEGQARQVASALRRLPANPRSLVASAARSQVNGRAARAFPPGTTVAPDTRSWAPDGIGGGTMLVTVTRPGRPVVSYDAIMVREAGRWKVLATIRIVAPVSARNPS
jgi:hypothetical protein